MKLLSKSIVMKYSQREYFAPSVEVMRIIPNNLICSSQEPNSDGGIDPYHREDFNI